jgi:hypothetical protein
VHVSEASKRSYLQRDGTGREACEGAAMKLRLIRPILCPLCGFRMGKGDMHINGFQCPGCAEWLHIDTDDIYTIAKPVAWAYIISFFVTLSVGLSWWAVLAWSVGAPLALGGVVAFIRGWFWPKLARGAIPRGKVSLRVTPPDDLPKKE